MWEALRVEEIEAEARKAVSPTPDGGRCVESSEEPSEFRLGDRLAGRYELVEFLARGGMGDVFVARDTALGERVAVKILRSNRAADPEALRRFKREILLARRVTHPNVCRIFEYGQHVTLVDEARGMPGVLFLTMELLEGETLAERLHRCGRMSEAEVMPLLRQMAAALDAAHAAGVVHRDLKASNVSLVPVSCGEGGEDRVVITDFGLARSFGAELDLLQGLTVDGTIVGTPSYMAPEQIRGEEVTAATDLYALGVLLYRMLTGVLPFGGKSVSKMMRQRLSAPPPSPLDLVPELDPKWAAAVLKCLEPEPPNRFQSGGELVDWLEVSVPRTPGRTQGEGAPGRGGTSENGGEAVRGASAAVAVTEVEEEEDLAAVETRRLLPGDLAPGKEKVSEQPDPEGSIPNGSVLAGRYRIICFIAEGGAAEVYEAEDRNLGERIALKAIRPGIANDKKALERFRREIQLARRVTHPNVCRIFDLQFHGGREEKLETPTPFASPDQPAPSLAGDSSADSSVGYCRAVVFMTMELLNGMTLAQKLSQCGRFSVENALTLIEQMGAALHAAHRVGVIHRDFKSQNVMLVPAPAGDRVRVVVTDFGVARAISGEDGEDSTLTKDCGGIVGTPDYMSPEQVEGEDCSFRSDIYSFGVVVYEMVTGRLPFEGKSKIFALFRRLEERPLSPLEIVPDLDPKWASAILRCLELKPKDRFKSIREAVRALGGRRLSSRRPAAQVFRPRWWIPVLRPVAFALLLVLVAFAGYAASYLLSSGQWFRTPSVHGESRPSIAMLGFKNLSRKRETAWLSGALSDVVVAALAEADQFEIIPSEAVVRMKLELSVTVEDSLAQDSLLRIRDYLGADFVVMGSYLALRSGKGQALRIQLAVQDTQRGDTVRIFSETGTVDGFLDVVSGAVMKLRKGLRLQTKVNQ